MLGKITGSDGDGPMRTFIHKVRIPLRREQGSFYQRLITDSDVLFRCTRGQIYKPLTGSWRKIKASRSCILANKIDTIVLSLMTQRKDHRRGILEDAGRRQVACQTYRHVGSARRSRNSGGVPDCGCAFLITLLSAFMITVVVAWCDKSS